MHIPVVENWGILEENEDEDKADRGREKEGGMWSEDRVKL